MGTNSPGGDLKVAKENKPNASWEIRGNKPKKEVDRDTFSETLWLSLRKRPDLPLLTDCLGITGVSVTE